MASNGAAKGDDGERVALICGVTGIVGHAIARHLLAGDGGRWNKVYGFSRRRPEWLVNGVEHLQLDALDSSAAANVLRGVSDVTHVFWATWVMRDSEEANIADNCTMMKNVLDALLPDNHLRHVTLNTGAKHYLGPFSTFGKVEVENPFREDNPRLPLPNFYYNLEDMLFEYAAEHGFTWTVHRPSNIVGFAQGNYMNLALSLAIYASVCKHEGAPLLFPGNRTAWQGLQDLSDADLIAEQHSWACREPRAANNAFNVSNGDVYRWKYLWPKVAHFYGLEAGEFSGEPAVNLEEWAREKEGVWRDIVKAHGLRPETVDDLKSFWFPAAVLRPPVEVVCDMNKSKRHGFLNFRESERSLLGALQQYRDERFTL